MSDETHGEKIARIDANVQMLVATLPKIHELDRDSAVNKTEHLWAKRIAVLLATPAALWICKALGLPLF